LWASALFKASIFRIDQKMSSGQKILVIDDDKDMVEALKIILEGESYKVKAAFDGKQGLEIIRKERPDLIILDLLLPGEDGVAISRSLKDSPEYQDIPILVLTALARKMEDKIFPRKGKKTLKADEYLDKPINPEKLLAKAKKLLK